MATFRSGYFWWVRYQCGTNICYLPTTRRSAELKWYFLSSQHTSGVAHIDLINVMICSQKPWKCWKSRKSVHCWFYIEQWLTCMWPSIWASELFRRTPSKLFDTRFHVPLCVRRVMMPLQERLVQIAHQKPPRDLSSTSFNHVVFCWLWHIPSWCRFFAAVRQSFIQSERCHKQAVAYI